MNNFEKRPKDGYGFIYKYTSPSGKSYIGQTIRSLKERANGNGIGYLNCSIFFSAIQKYGFENFEYEILGEFPIEELDKKEEEFISKENCLQPNGYNCQKGGKNQYYSKRDKKVRAINQFDLNGVFIKQYKTVASAAKDNNTIYQAISAVLCRKRKQHNGYIYRYADEDPPSPVTVQKTKGRTTAQYTMDGELIQIFPSACQAALAIGKNSNAGRNIRSVCEGKRKSAFGFKWKFLD